MLYGILYACSVGLDGFDYCVELSFLFDPVFDFYLPVRQCQVGICGRACAAHAVRGCELFCGELSLLTGGSMGCIFLGTAVTITDNYTFSLSYRFVFVILGFVWLMILGEKLRLTVRKTRIRLIALAVSVVLMFGYVSLIQVEEVEDAFGMDDILFTPNVLYRNNGFMAAFLANLRYLDVEKPQGYSADAAEHIQSMYEKEEGEVETGSEDLFEKPNIIVIMNEAFADLSVYGDFETSSEYMPFIRSLQKKYGEGKSLRFRKRRKYG